MKKLLMVIFLVVFSCLSTVTAQKDILMEDKSREFLLQKRYLNFPVKNGTDKDVRPGMPNQTPDKVRYR